MDDEYPTRDSSGIVSTAGTFTPFKPKRFEMTQERKEMLFAAGGAAIGFAQVALLKKFMDDAPPSWYPSSSLAFLGGFSKPSALISIASGAIGIFASLFFLKDKKIRDTIIAYGGASIGGGIMSGAGII